MFMEEASSSGSIYISMFWIAAVAVVAPIAANLLRGFVPATVLLIVGGVLIGPEALDLAAPEGLGVLKQFGIGFMFLLAGYELDIKDLWGRLGQHAWVSWVISFVIAYAVTVVLIPGERIATGVAFALAATSSALGALVPILQERGLEGGKLARSVMIYGAVGELGPIIVMALLLGGQSPVEGAATLGLFAIVAGVLVLVPRRAFRGIPHLYRDIVGASSGSTQMGLRLIILTLTGLMALAAIMSLDVVLGAFAAGVIARRLVPIQNKRTGRNIELVGYTIFIPTFFVLAGITLDVAAVFENPGVLIQFLLAITIIRGGGVYLVERFSRSGSDLNNNEKVRLSLYSACGLPIIVAVTELAVAADLMDEAVAATLIAAGALTLLIFPFLASRLEGAAKDTAPTPTT